MNGTREASADGGGFPVSLRRHLAAQRPIREFFRAQSVVRRRSRLARIFGASVLSEESQRWFRDALGEQIVGDALAHLGSDWHVFHAVPLGAGHDDIDHLAVGPGGVYAITTMSYPDQRVLVAPQAFEVAGNRHDHIRNAEFDVGHVERLLGAARGSAVHAMGVIVVVETRSITVHGMPRDVAVVRSAELVGWLRARPPIHSEAEVETLAALADLPTTWLPAGSLPDSVPGEDAPSLRARFDEVRREVRIASTIRRLWLVAITSCLLGLVGLAAWGVALATMVQRSGG